MSDLNDQNTKALVHENMADIDNFLVWFGSRPSWDDWARGDDAAYLEGLKTGLIGLAHCVETRLQEIYAPGVEQTDFGV